MEVDIYLIKHWDDHTGSWIGIATKNFVRHLKGFHHSYVGLDDQPVLVLKAQGSELVLLVSVVIFLYSSSDLINSARLSTFVEPPECKENQAFH